MPGLGHNGSSVSKVFHQLQPNRPLTGLGLMETKGPTSSARFCAISVTCRCRADTEDFKAAISDCSCPTVCA